MKNVSGTPKKIFEKLSVYILRVALYFDDYKSIKDNEQRGKRVG